MKSKFKKVVALTLSLSFASGLAACGDRGGQQVTIDTGKSQIFVGIWEGGLKSNWADRWARDFEKLHEETVFEEGKKGVQVVVTESTNYIDDRCATKLPEYKDDIIFCEQVNYYEFLNAQSTLDITDWVTTPLTEYNETRSIVDKMSDWDKNYYGQDSLQEFYGVPWSNSMLAINYDMELFEENNLYFAAQGQGDSKGFVKNMDTPKGLGPDGRTGIIDGVDYTADDGLPQTYDDFFKMCDKIVDLGYIPFIWAGGFQLYMTQLVSTLVADAEGYDNMVMNYTFDGTAKDLVKTIEDGIIQYEDEIKITNENGYLLKKQVGNYYALKFFHRLLTTTNSSGDPKYYTYNDCFGSGLGHEAAQTKFLRSTLGNQPIAMFVDGTWWYNEASKSFASMSSTPGKGQYERKLGIMSLPKATPEKVGEDATWVNSFITSVVVNKETVKGEGKTRLVKEFFRYIHTDKALTSYIYDAHCMRPYDFELTGIEESAFSPYTIQQYKIYNSSKVVQPYSTNDIIRSYLNQIHNNYQTTAGIGYHWVTTAFDDGISAEAYFYGMSDYMDSERWQSFLRGVK